MWTRTIDFLKDHLSPDTVEKYGPLPPTAAAQPAEITGQEETEAEGAGATSNGETVETGEIATPTDGEIIAPEGETGDSEQRKPAEAPGENLIVPGMGTQPGLGGEQLENQAEREDS